MFPTSKSDVFLQTTEATNGETITAALDTIGFNFVAIDIISTTSNNETNNPSVLKLGESDDATTYTDITALVGDGAGGFTVPEWHTNTATAKVMRFEVDLRTRKRYLLLTVTPVTTQSFTAVAHLYRGTSTPVSASDVNALAVASA
jgi:hypothetical protein